MQIFTAINQTVLQQNSCLQQIFPELIINSSTIKLCGIQGSSTFSGRVTQDEQVEFRSAVFDLFPLC